MGAMTSGSIGAIIGGRDFGERFAFDVEGWQVQIGLLARGQKNGDEWRPVGCVWLCFLGRTWATACHGFPIYTRAAMLHHMIAVIAGTRPDCIKQGPTVAALRAR